MRGTASTSSAFVVTLLIVEGNPSGCIEARFALAAEDPDHDAYERNDKDKKVDCRSHGHTSLYPAERARTAAINGSLSDLRLLASGNRLLRVGQRKRPA